MAAHSRESRKLSINSNLVSCLGANDVRLSL